MTLNIPPRMDRSAKCRPTMKWTDCITDEAEKTRDFSSMNPHRSQELTPPDIHPIALSISTDRGLSRFG